MRTTKQMWSVRAIAALSLIILMLAATHVQVSADQENYARFSNVTVDCATGSGMVNFEYSFLQGSRFVATGTVNQNGVDMTFVDELEVPAMSGNDTMPFAAIADGTFHVKFELFNADDSLASSSEYFSACPTGETWSNFSHANSSPRVPSHSTVSENTNVSEAVPGCDATITIPNNAIGGVFVTDAAVYWAPGQITEPVVTISAGNTTRVIGTDQTGEYHQVLWGCQYLWVPVNSLAPNAG